MNTVTENTKELYAVEKLQEFAKFIDELYEQTWEGNDDLEVNTEQLLNQWLKNNN